MNGQLAVTPRRSSRPAIKFNRCGQHKSVVVVGVFADKIHAPRCPVKACGRPKARLESVQNLQGCFQRPLLSQTYFPLRLKICSEPQKPWGAWGVMDGCGTLLLRIAAARL